MSRANHGDSLPTPNLVPGGQQVPLGGRYQGGPGMFAPSPFAIANPTTSPPPAGVRALPTIVELVHSFKRRWVLALLVGGLIGTALAVAIWMVMPSGKHEARAIIQIKTEIPGFTEKTNRLDNDQFDKMVDADLARMKTKQFFIKVANDPKVKNLPMIATSDVKERVIEGALHTKRDPSEIVRVSMTGDDKDQLRMLLDTFTKMFIEDCQALEAEQLNHQLIHIQKMLSDLNQSISAKEKQMEDGAQTGVGIAIDKVMTQKELERVAEKIRGLKDQHEISKQNLDQLKKEKADPALIVINDSEVNEEIEKNTAVLARGAVYSAARQKLEAMQKAFAAGSKLLDEYIQAESAALQDLNSVRESARKQEVDKLKRARIANMDRELTAATRKVSELESLISGAESEQKRLGTDLKNLAQRGLQQNDARDNLSPSKRDREEFSSQERRIKLLLGSDDANKPSRYKLLEEAVVYENYNLKTKLAFAIGAAVVGLLAISLIVAYLEWRNRRVDGVDQVVTELGMRVIGTIPAFPSRAALRSGEASQNQNWRFILNESVNSTRTMLLHTAKTQQMQVILVTSAMQGEGKTSLSSQLATSMATAGLRTLVLDCDLRNPSLQKLFDIPVAPGCAEILLQEIDVGDAVQQTTVPNLWIIPAGQCNHRVIAALAQGHPLEALFNRLRGQFDIIIVDSCPILPVADTLLVAQHVDGVVFSILQDVSQLPKVQDASDRLVQLNIPLLGAVVNGITPDIQAYGYNYVKQLPA